MAHPEIGNLEASACPHLGLAADPRSHADESLGGIAADHGVTADQVARADGFAVTDAVAYGVRLVIPLVPASSTCGPTPDHRRPDRFG
jgi:hypothetical protein